MQKEGFISKYRKNIKQSSQSIKVKDNSLRNAGMVGGRVATDQLEGGQEIQQAFSVLFLFEIQGILCLRQIPHI